MAVLNRLPQLAKWTVVLVCLVLFGMLLRRDYFVSNPESREAAVLRKSREESFTGVYFQNSRIGYVKQRLVPQADHDLQLTQDAFLRLNILEEEHPVDLQIRATLAADMRLKDFDFHLNSPFYEMHAQGRVDDALIRFTLTTGKETIRDTIKLEKPPFISTHHRAYLLNQGLQKGDKIKIPYFDPISLSGQETLLEYRGREKVLILGRMHNLHKFVENFSGLRISSWLNDDGLVIKEESPTGFVFLAEPEFKARDIPASDQELLTGVSIPLNGPRPDLERLDVATYEISLPSDTPDLRLKDERQQWQGDLLTINRRPEPPTGSPSCGEVAHLLAATPYIQTDHPEIRAQAASIAPSTLPTAARVARLSHWVFNNLKKRPVIGIPDALTTLASRQGDCNEHAALFAALARSAGIPTRVVAGVTLMEQAFYYHAWNEVCVDGQWLSVDTTVNQLPADVGHIKFVTGGNQEMLKLGALLGNLSIRLIPEQESDDAVNPAR